jgi:hypothetical protein
MIISFLVGSTMCNLFEGNISLTPPTFVEIQCNPRVAASTKAIPKDSVKAGLKNI